MVTISCTTEDHLELDQLTEFQGGLKNRTDGDYAKIIVSIQKYGFSFPFFVWSHDGINHVLDGHGRLGALKKLKAQGEVIPPLPVVYVDCGNEENAKNLLLRLNSQYGQMTAESVMEFMSGFEFDPYEISLPAGVLDLNIDPQVTVDDDETPEPQLDAPAISKTGEIYQLGPHRLMCGDSTKDDDVARLMDGEKAEILFTSPPYSDMREYNGDKNLDGDHLASFIQVYAGYTAYEIVNLGLQMKDHEIFPYWDTYIEYAHKAGLKMLAWNVWDKTTIGSIGAQRQFFPLRHEWLFVFGREPKQLNRYVEKKTKYDPAKKTRLVRKADGHMSNDPIGDCSNPYKTIESVLAITPEYAAETRHLHPAVFPAALPGEYIKSLTDKGDIIIDPFGGSGTTLMAAAQLGRKCRMMEMDPIYCDVIRRRWTTWATENNLEPGEGALE